MWSSELTATQMPQLDARLALMSNTLSLAETLKRISSAFARLECAATAWDHNFRIKVTVFDPASKPLIVCEDLRVDVCTGTSRLDWMLREVASRVKARGFVLDKYPT